MWINVEKGEGNEYIAMALYKPRETCQANKVLSQGTSVGIWWE